MAKRDSDIGELARALKAPPFGKTDPDAQKTTLEPVSPTTLVLPVSDIKAYEHNPRQAENREYPRLKDSIRARRGLTTPLTVTKRPGDDLYTIGAGGNSRLKALKELAEETADEAFALVTCRFEPWDSECQVLANHLIENDIRGYILFGDKACAIIRWRELFEKAHPEEVPLSQRALADCLAKAGYRIPQSLLNRLLQAAEVLMPHLPKAFASGLGRPAVEQLIRLHQVALRYWDENVAGSQLAPESTFDEAFARTCLERDCHYQDWDYELFQSAFALQMARALQLDYKIVALDLDSLYHGHEVQVPAASEAPSAQDSQGLKSKWAFERIRESEALKAERIRSRLDSRKAVREPSGAVPFERSDGPPSVPEMPDEPAETATHPNRLRQSNFAIARRLAEAEGLEALVMPLETGLGFFIEAPDPPASRDAASETREDGNGVALSGPAADRWWLLCLASGVLEPSHLDVLAAAYPASWLVELFTVLPEQRPETDPLTALDVLVGEPSRNLVWDALTHPDLDEDERSLLAQLLRGCQALRAAAARARPALWEVS